MSIYLLSEGLCLLSELHYLTPHLLCMFSVVLFITSGGWIKVIIFPHCVTLGYMMKLLVRVLIW